MSALLEVRALRKEFPILSGLLRRRIGTVTAVDGVDLDLEPAETVALVGESGSGKTTLGRSILRLIEPTSGQVRLRGEDLLALSPRELRRRRRAIQMVFQDPYGSLNPRLRVGAAVAEPIEVHRLAPKSELVARARRLLDEVGLPPDAADRFPHEFSGGQRQRIGIARALATEPDLLIADEPVSALDVSVRAQVVNLLLDLRERRQLAILFVAHDLALVARIADRVAVMYLGRVVEAGTTRELLDHPQHPYTVALISAIPEPDPNTRKRRIELQGEPPSPARIPSGCRFHPRCPIARERCRTDDPALIRLGAPPLAGAALVTARTGSAAPDDTRARGGHEVACHYPGELAIPGAA